MIMCSKCKKRPAVVFITSVQGNEKKNEGLCLSCARAQNIPQIKEYMDKLGITDEELDQLSDQMMGMLDGDSFEMGGSGVLPDFITNMFGGNDVDEDRVAQRRELLYQARRQQHGLRRLPPLQQGLPPL